jgi:hypothetical protein
MADKLPHSRILTPVADTDVANKAYADEAGPDGTSNGIAVNKQSANFELDNSQYASVADSDAFTGITEMTVECWFTVESQVAVIDGFAGKSDTGSNQSFYFGTRDGTSFQTLFSSNGSSTGAFLITAHGGLTLGKWYHFAATWDGATGLHTVYLDGVVIGTPTNQHTGTLYDSALPFNIGKLGDHPYWQDGDLSELRVWNVARTIEEINDNMFRSVSGGELGLVVAYHLDGNFRDAGPNLLHCAGVNTPTFTSSIPWGAPAQSLVVYGGAV